MRIGLFRVFIPWSIALLCQKTALRFFLLDEALCGACDARRVLSQLNPDDYIVCGKRKNATCKKCPGLNAPYSTATRSTKGTQSATHCVAFDETCRIKLCPRGAKTCVLLLYKIRDIEINPMTLKLKAWIEKYKICWVKKGHGQNVKSS